MTKQLGANGGLTPVQVVASEQSTGQQKLMSFIGNVGNDSESNKDLIQMLQRANYDVAAFNSLLVNRARKKQYPVLFGDPTTSAPTYGAQYPRVNTKVVRISENPNPSCVVNPTKAVVDGNQRTIPTTRAVSSTIPSANTTASATNPLQRTSSNGIARTGGNGINSVGNSMNSIGTTVGVGVGGPVATNATSNTAHLISMIQENIKRQSISASGGRNGRSSSNPWEFRSSVQPQIRPPVGLKLPSPTISPTIFKLQRDMNQSAVFASKTLMLASRKIQTMEPPNYHDGSEVRAVARYRHRKQNSSGRRSHSIPLDRISERGNSKKSSNGRGGNSGPSNASGVNTNGSNPADALALGADRLDRDLIDNLDASIPGTIISNMSNREINLDMDTLSNLHDNLSNFSANAPSHAGSEITIVLEYNRSARLSAAMQEEQNENNDDGENNGRLSSGTGRLSGLSGDNLDVNSPPLRNQTIVSKIHNPALSRENTNVSAGSSSTAAGTGATPRPTGLKKFISSNNTMTISNEIHDGIRDGVDGSSNGIRSSITMSNIRISYDAYDTGSGYDRGADVTLTPLSGPRPAPLVSSHKCPGTHAESELLAGSTMVVQHNIPAETDPLFEGMRAEDFYVVRTSSFHESDFYYGTSEDDYIETCSEPEEGSFSARPSKSVVKHSEIFDSGISKQKSSSSICGLRDNNINSARSSSRQNSARGRGLASLRGGGGSHGTILQSHGLSGSGKGSSYGGSLNQFSQRSRIERSGALFEAKMAKRSIQNGVGAGANAIQSAPTSPVLSRKSPAGHSHRRQNSGRQNTRDMSSSFGGQMTQGESIGLAITLSTNSLQSIQSRASRTSNPGASRSTKEATPRMRSKGMITPSRRYSGAIHVTTVFVGMLPQEVLSRISEFLTNREKFELCIAGSRCVPDFWGICLVQYSKALAKKQKECEETSILTEIANQAHVTAQEQWSIAINRTRMLKEDEWRMTQNRARFDLDVAEAVAEEGAKMKAFQDTVQVLTTCMERWGVLCEQRDRMSAMCGRFHTAIGVAFRF